MKKTRSTTVLSFLGHAAVTLSCLALACVAGPDELDADERAVGVDPDAPGAGTYDQRLLAHVSRAVPEFAGLYVAGDTLVAATVGEADEEALWASVARVVTVDPHLRRTVRSDARYTFAELARWHEQVDAAVFGLADLVFTDADEQTQRLVIGVSSPAGERDARAAALDLGVPEDALAVVLTEPVRPLANVRDKLRPLAGGTQIAFSNFVCTLGFNARLAGNDGFVTNSHCTDVRGAVTGTKYGQPNKGEGVGTEHLDPFYWSGGGCDVPNGCRYSDSAFVKTTSAGDRRVALPPGEGSLEFNAYGRVASEEPWPLSGTSATKVGRTTGRTSGTITQACANVKSSDGYMLLCNYLVQSDHTLSQGGDSGSPVFRVIKDPSHGDINLMGVLWGGSTNRFVFSPLGGVEMELGAMKVCAPEIGC